MRFSLRIWMWIGLLGTLLVSGCLQKSKDEKIHVTLLQINDVYEIEPVSGRKSGGLARVATIRNELLKENPNTFTFIAGDFLSPSALGTAKVNGKALDGRQMVSVLNTMGMDYATFGNHEFDLKEDAFFERMSEAEFTWISSNVFGADGKLYEGVKTSEIITISGPGNTRFRMGLVGTTIRENNPSYVVFKDPFISLQSAVDELEEKSDAIVAITHLDFWDDMAIAKSIPELDLIIGGHDHENMFFRRGENYTPIAKADANAKSAFVHRLTFDPETGDVDIESTLVQINESIIEDPATKAVIDEWVEKGFEGFRSVGFKPGEAVTTIDFDLDGLEASVRSKATNLTRLIANAMVHDAGSAEFALFNGGSIRIDDKLTAGPVTQYDILRVLPFPGKVLSVNIKGSVLVRALNQLKGTIGNGAFLQTTANLKFENKSWALNGAPIVDDKVYRAAINDFLANGRQVPLTYLDINVPGSGIELIGSHSDTRLAVINELKRKYPVQD